jgi:hypothetical protein
MISRDSRHKKSFSRTRRALRMICGKTKREVDSDLKWNVVYAAGSAKDLGRYFSKGDDTTLQQVLRF